MGPRSKVEIPNQAGQYGDHIFPTSRLVYRIALATLKISIVTTKIATQEEALEMQ